MTIETEREADGRWIAEISSVSGALCYGATREEAVRRVEALAHRILADRLEHGESTEQIENVFTVVA